MSLNIVRIVLRAFALVIRLLSSCLLAIQKVLDIIDDGVENGSSVLPSWYFELVDVLNVLQESLDKVIDFQKSDILNHPVEK